MEVILKLIGSFLTISSMTAMGFYFSTLLRTRLEELKELKKYMLILKGDIRYSKTPLPEALENLASRSSGNFCGFFSSIAGRLFKMEGETFEQVWKEAVENCLGDTCLHKEDKICLKKFGENLGYLDKEMQMNTMDLYISQLEQQIEELSKVVGEKTRIYNILGIMAGVFVTIVMI